MAKKQTEAPLEVKSTYVPKPDIKQTAVKYLQSKGYSVKLDGGTVMGQFLTEAQYNDCRKLLIEKFGENKREIPFSFGGKIGAQAIQPVPTQEQETEITDDEENAEPIEEMFDEDI